MNYPVRKNPWLSKYDYSSHGAYFLTICTKDRKMLFSRIHVGAIHESSLHKRSVISKAVGYFKMNASKQIHEMGYPGEIWQRSFHDHVIRSQQDYDKIWNYIAGNPVNWEKDCFFVE